MSNNDLMNVQDISEAELHDLNEDINFLAEVNGKLYRVSAKDSGVTKKDLDDIKESLADVLYAPIEIGEFTSDKATVEKGSNVKEVTLSWTTNKVPTKLLLNGDSIDPTATSRTIAVSIYNDTTYSLEAIDDRDASAKASTTVRFCDRIFYGVSSSDTVSTSMLSSLSNKLQPSKAITFTVNPSTGEYIIFALPDSMGSPTFTIDGFEVTFSTLGSIIYTNSNGYSTTYTVYRSVRSGLGSTTVKVS